MQRQKRTNWFWTLQERFQIRCLSLVQITDTSDWLESSVPFWKRVWALILDERRIKIKNVQMIMTLAIRTFSVLNLAAEKIPNIALHSNMRKNLLENLIWHQKKVSSTIILNIGSLNWIFHQFLHTFCTFRYSYFNGKSHKWEVTVACNQKYTTEPPQSGVLLLECTGFPKIIKYGDKMIETWVIYPL